MSNAGGPASGEKAVGTGAGMVEEADVVGTADEGGSATAVMPKSQIQPNPAPNRLEPTPTVVR